MNMNLLVNSCHFYMFVLYFTLIALLVNWNIAVLRKLSLKFVYKQLLEKSEHSGSTHIGERGTNYNVCYQQVVALLSLPMISLNCCNHSNHIIASWNNTPDAHFTQLRFEAPQVSVMYRYISCIEKKSNLYLIFGNGGQILIFSKMVTTS